VNLLNLFIRNETFSLYIRRFPQTTIILLLNTIYFLYLKLFAADVPLQELWGIYNIDRIHDGEWYRLLTAMFTHLDFMHFFLNAISIYLFASVLEYVTRAWMYAVIYFGSGAFSYLCVYVLSDATFTVGASGAVFGMFGALFYLSRNQSSLFDRATRNMLNIIIIFNLVATFLIADVSAAGHIGGLLAGYALAYLLRIERLHNRSL
jgi:rhomboid protease GluP